jgi:bacterioferritin-associated ferredoxin
MYVCICQAVTDREIRDAAEGGARNVRELGQRLGVATGCGSCAAEARRILREHRRRDGGTGGFGPELAPATA